MEIPCYQCGKPLSGLILPLSRREECRHCSAQMHCCRMCLHYQPHRQQWCAEERAEPPSSQQLANFCDYFALNTQAWAGDQPDPNADALDKLSSLFDD